MIASSEMFVGHVLNVIFGTGRYQLDGAPVEEIIAGDIGMAPRLNKLCAIWHYLKPLILAQPQNG